MKANIENQTRSAELEPTNRRILLIDDNEAIHGDFRKILCNDGADRSELDAQEEALFGSSSKRPKWVMFEMESAHQGREGLAMVEQALEEGRPYAVAFVDVRMPPGWDGVETTARLWKADPDLQIVICTAYSDYAWDELVSKVGETDQLVMLKKPFDAIELLQVANAFTAKWQLSKQARLTIGDLQQSVTDRTAQWHQSEEQFRLAMEHSAIGMALVSPEGRWLKVNPALCRIVGYSNEELMAKDFQSITHSEDVEASETNRRRLLDGEIQSYHA